MIEIKEIPEDQLQEAFQLKVQYLDDDPFETFAGLYREYPDLFVGCFNPDNLIGICYGRPSKVDLSEGNGSIVLQGIAVRHEFSRQGYGTQLLKFFEAQVRKRRCWTISLGSSSAGYVEQFYIKNGYSPIEYLIRLKAKGLIRDYRDKGFHILHERLEGDERLVKIKADRYDPDFKQELQRVFCTDRINYIFEKDIR